jgi:hypothetical protein
MVSLCPSQLPVWSHAFMVFLCFLVFAPLADWERGRYFAPMLRNALPRCKYPCDSKPADYAPHGGSATCTHKFQNAKKSFSGVFTVMQICQCDSASRRRVCGFTVMKDREGPKTAFNDIMLRVPIGQAGAFMLVPDFRDIYYVYFLTSKLVGMTHVVYDHGCGADAYGWRREPRLMMEEMVTIDRLHSCTHVGCTPGYCINEYKHHPVLSVANSMANEQFFSFLDNYTRTLRYLGSDRLMLFLQYLIHSWNEHR